MPPSEPSISIEITVIQEHPVKEANDVEAGELRVKMPPKESCITHRWFYLRPLEATEEVDQEAQGKILLAIDVIPFQDEWDLKRVWLTDFEFFPYMQWPQILKLSKISKLQLCLNEIRNYMDSQEKRDYRVVNKDTLGGTLISYSPRLCYQLGVASGDYDDDKFLALGKLFECPIIDRTGTLYIERST